MVGCWIGAIEGDIIGQMVGEQMGAKSIAFSQSGCTCPLTHSQTHSARAVEIPATNPIKKNAAKPGLFMAIPRGTNDAIIDQRDN
jgi:hypothetical protein